jgi:hypothetical protein
MLIEKNLHDESILLYAFDLIELNGDDLRRDPLEGRKATPPGVDSLTVGRGGPGVDTHKGRSWWGGSRGALHVTFCPGGGQNPRRDALRLSASPAPIAR